MNPWTDSAAFGMGLLCAGAGFAFLLLAWAAARRSRQSDGLVGVVGKAEALAELGAPVTGRSCVCYHQRVDKEADAAQPAGRSGGILEQLAGPGHVVDRVSGVFLLQGDGVPVLVWPGLGTVRFAEGWTEQPREGGLYAREKIIAAGAALAVRGQPGRYDEMMSAMAGAAADQPFEILRVLQTREDLRGLSCFWPRDGRLEVTELVGAPDEPASAGLFLVAALACLAVGALLIGGARARLF